jgi:hypothetical protein
MSQGLRKSCVEGNVIWLKLAMLLVTTLLLIQVKHY